MHARQVIEINKICAEVLSVSNPYYLSEQEKKDFDIVTNTLLYIAVQIDIEDSALRKCLNGPNPGLFYIAADMSRCAIIHLEEFKGLPAGQHRSNNIVESLVSEFITCFDFVKAATVKDKKNYVKIYAGKMNAVCIDARTRDAFEFGRTLGKAPSFSDMVEEISQTLKDQRSYFQIFKLLLLQYWHKPYSAVVKSTLVMEQKEGQLNRDKLPFIKEYLPVVSEPEADFFIIYRDIPKAQLTDFFQFVLLHKGYLALLSRELVSVSDIKAFNQFMVIAFVDQGDIEAAAPYLELLPADAFMEIWRLHISGDLFKKLTESAQRRFIDLFLPKFHLASQLRDELIYSLSMETRGVVPQLLDLDRPDVVLNALADELKSGQKILTLARALKAPAVVARLTIPMGNTEERFQIITEELVKGNCSFAANILVKMSLPGKFLSVLVRVIDSYHQSPEERVTFHKTVMILLIKRQAENEALQFFDEVQPDLVDMAIDEDENTILHLAAQLNQKNLVAALIARGGAITRRNKKGQTPLAAAAEAQASDTVKFLSLKVSEIITVVESKNDGGLGQALLYATKYNKPNDAMDLLSLNAPVNSSSPEQLQALHYAVINNDCKLADAILQSKRNDININARVDESSRTVWICVAESPLVSEETIIWLLNHSELDLLCTYKGKTGFQIAKELKHPAIGKLLKENTKPITEYLYLLNDSDHIARVLAEIYKANGNIQAFIQSLDRLEKFLSPDAHIEIIKSLTKMVAIYCVQNDDTEVLALLIKVASEVVFRHYTGEDTLLHYAAKFNKPKIAKQLIDAGAIYCVQNEAGDTPMMSAARHRSWETISQMSDVQADAKDEVEYGFPLLYALADNMVDLAIKLIYAGGSPFNWQRNSLHAIHYALLTNSLDLMRAIFAGSNSVIGFAENIANYRLLIFAAKTKEIKDEMVSFLLEQKQINANEDEDGKNALYFASETKQYGKTVILALHDRYPITAIIRQQKEHSHRYVFAGEVLAEVSKREDLDLFTDFLFKVVDMYIFDRPALEGIFSIFLNAAAAYHIDNGQLIDYLMQIQAYFPRIINLYFGSGRTTLLHVAAARENTSMISALLAKGAGCWAHDASGECPLTQSLLAKSWPVVNQLLGSGTINHSNLDRAFLIATKALSDKDPEPSLDVCKRLLEQKLSMLHGEVDSALIGNPKLKAIHYAVLGNQLAIVEAILRVDKSINARVDGESPTPLIMAMRNTNVDPEMICWLLKYPGCDLTYRYRDKTALQYCFSGGHPRFKKKILSDKALQLEILLSLLSSRNYSSALEFILALEQETKAVLPLWEALNGRFNYTYQGRDDKERYGRALISCLKNHLLLMAEYFLYADASMICIDGYTALHHAVEQNRLPLAENIYIKHHNINYRLDDQHKTPLIVAAENKDVDIRMIIWLLSHKEIDFSCRYQGKTALQIAYANRHPVFILLFENSPRLLEQLIADLSTDQEQAELFAAIRDKSLRLTRDLDVNIIGQDRFELLERLRAGGCPIDSSLLFGVLTQHKAKFIKLFYAANYDSAVQSLSKIPEEDKLLRHKKVTNQIRLCDLIMRLSRQRINPQEDLNFLVKTSLNDADFAETLAYFASSGLANIHDAIYIVKNARQVMNGHFDQSVVEEKVDMRTTVSNLNHLYTLVENANVNDAYTTLGKIRQSSYRALEKHANALANVAERNALLDWAKTQRVYCKLRYTHKYNFFQMIGNQFRDSVTVRQIQGLRR